MGGLGWEGAWGGGMQQSRRSRVFSQDIYLSGREKKVLAEEKGEGRRAKERESAVVKYSQFEGSHS